MARVNKAPATIFLTAAAVPLIPGGSLYYTMLGIVEKDSAAFSENGIAALTIALAISLGFVIVALSNKYINIFYKVHKSFRQFYIVLEHLNLLNLCN